MCSVQPTVRAERYWESEPDDQILARERRQGQYTRQLLLGEHLDADGLEPATRTAF